MEWVPFLRSLFWLTGAEGVWLGPVVASSSLSFGFSCSLGCFLFSLLHAICPFFPPPPAPPGQWRILVDSVWLGPDPWEQRVVQGALVKIPGATLSHREVATCGISSSWVMLTPCSILVSQAWKWVTRFGIFILSSPAPRYTQPSALGS